MAQQAPREVAIYLGIGIANLINALNPQLVVFGGLLSVASDFLLPTIEEVLDKRTLRWSRQATPVIRAAHGFEACVIGGLATIYHRVLSRPSMALHYGADTNQQAAPTGTA